jgi:hypothetical protein
MIWLISGLHDPQWLDNIISNYKRQTFPCKLLIVENGKGLGVAWNVDSAGVYIIRSDTGVSQYINAGLNWLREVASPSDWFCKFDSDDYYGPEYVHQIAQNEQSDYVGSSSLYIKTISNNLWYLQGESTTIFHGPTLAGRIGTALDFPIVQDWGEDGRWCHAMQSVGRVASVILPENFCYQRWDNYNHVWPCSDMELRALWLKPMIDLGNFDLDIVNGLKQHGDGVVLDIPEITIDNFMPFRILREKSLNCIGL